MGRLADGRRAPRGRAARRHRDAVRRPAAPGRPRPYPLPGARRHGPRRADEPPRPDGQAVADGRAGDVPRRPPRRQPRPAAARPVDHEGVPPRPTAGSTSTRGPTRATAPSSRPTRTSGSGRPSSRAARSSGSPRWPTPCAARPSVGPGSPSRSTAGSNGSKASARRSSPGSARASSAYPCPSAPATVPLTVRHLAVRYGDETVLTDVDFPVGRGDRIVVIGRNGAGKSSLLRCLAGVQEPTDGSVTIGSQRVHRLLRPGARAGRPDPDGARERRRLGAEDRRRTPGPARLVRAAVARPPTRCPATLSGGERAKLGSGHAGRRPGQPADPRRADQQPRPAVDRGRRPDAQRWPGTLVVVSHDRSFVAALDPTHALRPARRALRLLAATSTSTTSPSAEPRRPAGPSGRRARAAGSGQDVPK